MDTKSFLTSKTFWGLLVTVVAQVAPFLFTRFGLTPDAQTQATIVSQIVTFVSLGFAAYGRYVANKPLHVIPPKK